MRVYERGDLVTGPAAVSQTYGAWSATADGPALLLAIPFEAWFDQMEAHFDLAHCALAALAREREEILDRLAHDCPGIPLLLR